jgi:hypothetical protein
MERDSTWLRCAGDGCLELPHSPGPCELSGTLSEVGVIQTAGRRNVRTLAAQLSCAASRGIVLVEKRAWTIAFASSDTPFAQPTGPRRALRFCGDQRVEASSAPILHERWLFPFAELHAKGTICDPNGKTIRGAMHEPRCRHNESAGCELYSGGLTSVPLRRDRCAARDVRPCAFLLRRTIHFLVMLHALMR